MTEQTRQQKIEHFNETIESGITFINEKGLETINVTRTCNREANKDKETLSMHDNEGEGKTSSTSEKKEKACDSYVSMYE